MHVTLVHEEQARAGASEFRASEAGLRNLTRCLGLEFATDGVTAVNVAPGLVLTPMNRRDLDDPEQLAKDEATVPLRRAVRPEDVRV